MERTPQPVRIGRRYVGPGHPVYVIAEAGVNHNGDLATAKRLIDAAREACADAVKFQVFSADRLTSADAPCCEYQQARDRRAGNQRSLLRRLELEPASVAELKAYADERGLDFLATPFGPAEVRTLVAVGAAAIKIASPDIVNTPLLESAAATGLSIIASTGAATLGEVETAVRIIVERGAALVLLHCVSAYPTKPTDARLACIRTLAARFNVPTGFSDHTVDADFSAAAVLAGADILEKHLTLDRDDDGPDHFFSLEPARFAEYVAAARRARAIMGPGEIQYSPAETEVRRLARGSIIAAHPIAAGARLTAYELAVQRPGDGIGPEQWNDVLGRIARTDIPANTRLDWSMLV